MSPATASVVTMTMASKSDTAPRDPVGEWAALHSSTLPVAALDRGTLDDHGGRTLPLAGPGTPS
jgi:hypothetical protein